MQIFTYVDSNLALQANKNANYEALFTNRMQKKVVSKNDFEKSQENVVVCEKLSQKEIFLSLKDFALKHRVFLIIFAFLYFLSAFIPLFINSINISVKKSNLDLYKDVDVTLLNGAMKKFALSEYGYSFDEEGFVEASGSNLKYALESVTFQNYKVKSGENITSITKKFGLSNISSIISVNEITNDRSLMSGQYIKIPSMDGLLYTAKSGDSLSSISKRYNITMEALLDVNDLTSDDVKIGQKIFIPGACLDPATLKKTLGTTFVCPIKAKWRLTSAYGYRSDPFTGVKKFHTGMDMACPTGTPVYATMQGKVIEVSYNSVYGNYIVISHANGYQSLYAHLSATNVRKGQSVMQDAKIGLVGSTGYSTGSHLHFTVYKNGKLQNPHALLKR